MNLKNIISLIFSKWSGVGLGFIMLLFLANCAKNKSKEDMSFEELEKKSVAYLEKKRYDDASEYLEQIIAKFSDRADIHRFKMILADTYFKAGNYPSACQMYDHYNQYYPSDRNAEYSKYQSVLAQFYQTLKTDCDQTATEETIKRCCSYLETNGYQQYKRDVQDIQNTCEHKLINKEIYVYNFYLQQEKYDAAKNRLNYLKTHYLPKKKTLEPQLLYLECKLAQKQQDNKLIQKNVETLFSQYPESQFTRMTQSLFNKREFEF